MSNEIFKMAVKINPDYHNYKIGDKVHPKNSLQISTIFGYIDVYNGGVLLKDPVYDGKNERHLWYMNELEKL